MEAYNGPITARVVELTPELAAKYLERNTRNRPIDTAHVAQYAEDMLAGKWTDGVARISFDVLNRMANGQHVCHAVIKSGVTVIAIAVEGLPKEAIRDEDTPKRRSFGEFLHIEYDPTNAKYVAGAVSYTAKAIRAFEHRTRSNLSRAELEELYLDRSVQFEAAVRLARPAHRAVRLSPAIAAAVIVLATPNIGTPQADKPERAIAEFFEQVAHGEGLRRGDPAYMLREQVRTAMAQKAKRPWEDYFTWTAKAWQAYELGRTVGNLRRDPGDLFDPRPR